ncbi:SRPBCC family protein [Pseudonocardia aurantiaca]|uniref:SRPBCC family protein n=1 Tax=Pseudonocardia aurantiaca TaxID=75290 RepID=A0ABW4FEE1_9PSEU
MTQSVHTGDDGRSVLRMERRLKQSPEKVWRAVTEPERLAEWFPTTVTPDLREGGAVEFGFGSAGIVTDLDEPRLFAFTWDDDHLRLELHPDGYGTRLVLVHTFADRAGAASFAAGWHTCIAALGLALDGRAGEDPGVDHIAMHERYVAEFGLETPVVEGATARIERQLTRPAQDVWKALEAEAPADAVRDGDVLEYPAAGGGTLRWELGEGTGHGPRLFLTHVGAGGDPATATAELRGLVARLTQ